MIRPSGSSIRPRHFGWHVEDRVAIVTLNRPERKNPLTLESYRELTDTFLALREVGDVKVVVLTGAGENFCSGGDVHDIIVSSGYNIAGPEVENVLLEHEAVLECAVAGVPDVERGQLVKAVIVLREGTP